MPDEQNNETNPHYEPAVAMERVIQEHEARVNITWQGQNGDLPDPVSVDASDGDIKQMASEAIRGGIPGINADHNADFTDFVVDRFPPRDDVPYNRIMLRPKTPFGVPRSPKPSKAAQIAETLTWKGASLLSQLNKDGKQHLDDIDNRILNPLVHKKLVLISDKGVVRVSALGKKVAKA